MNNIHLKNMPLKNIHLKWLTEEYVNRIFKFILKTCRTVPRIILDIIKKLTKKVVVFIRMINVGAIFWIDKKINKFSHFIFRVISGIQTWRGAAPIFILRLRIISMGIRNSKLFMSLFTNIFIFKVSRKIIELIVWMRKYFIICSLSLLFIRNIIKTKVLISKSTQIKMRFFLDIIIIGRVKINAHFKIYKKLNFQWGMSPLAFIAYLITTFSFFLLEKVG